MTQRELAETIDCGTNRSESKRALLKQQRDKVTDGWHRSAAAPTNVVLVRYPLANYHPPLSALWRCVELFIAACIRPSKFEKADGVVQPKPSPVVMVTIMFLAGIFSISICKRPLRELLFPIDLFTPQ